MFCESLARKVTSEDLCAMATAMANSNMTIKLQDPISSYVRNSVIAYVVLMITVMDFEQITFYEDREKDSMAKLKINFLQKQIKSCYSLEVEMPASTILPEDLEADVVESS